MKSLTTKLKVVKDFAGLNIGCNFAKPFGQPLGVTV